MSGTRIQGAVLGGLVLSCLTGCLVVPKDTGLRSSDHVYSSAVVELLKDPGTDRRTLLRELGYPLTKSTDGDVYLYLFAWTSRSTEIHLIDPVTLPLAVYGGLLGGGVPPDDMLYVHRKATIDSQSKVILLVEFDQDGRVVDSGAFAFPREVIPDQIVEDWKADPRPGYLTVED